MGFEICKAIEVLSATPITVRALLGKLSEEWTGTEQDRGTGTENPEWQPYDVLGHLIHGEDTDWIPRARIILAQGESVTFEAFDRFAMFENSKGKSLGQLLDEFEEKRLASLDSLRSWNLTNEQLDMVGEHPELGRVTLRQLLATWVVHDLTHIRQIVTVMATRYDGEVGVWREYLSILKA